MTATRSRVSLALWLAFLIFSLAGLETAGRGALAAPPLTDPAGLSAWLSERSGAEVGFAALRVVLQALAWYLLVTTGLVVAARVLSVRPLATVVEVVALSAVRDVVRAGVGLSLTAVAVATDVGTGRTPAGPVAAHASAWDGAGAVMTWLGEAHDTPVMRRLPDADAAAAAPEAPRPAPDATEGEWTVQPGDHLWRISAEVLSRAWQRPVTEGEIAPYWLRLVEANRGRLVDPANPDLLLPAQVMAVPAPPAPPAAGPRRR